METAYEVWRGVMYCVGVFVTCNVGGAALRLARDRVSGLMKPHEDDSVEAVKDMDTVIRDIVKGMESMITSMGTVITIDTGAVQHGGGQSFEDIQRQIHPEESTNAPAGEGE